MKQVLLLMVFFLILTKICLGDWQACSVDSDCKVVMSCYTWGAINKKYVDSSIEAISDCDGAMMYGQGPEFGRFQPITVCANNKCTLTNKTTNVDMKEWEQWSQKEKNRIARFRSVEDIIINIGVILFIMSLFRVAKSVIPPLLSLFSLLFVSGGCLYYIFMIFNTGKVWLFGHSVHSINGWWIICFNYSNDDQQIFFWVLTSFYILLAVFFVLTFIKLLIKKSA